MIPYSQHYRCSIELFGNIRTGIVFQYLFDEFLYNYRINGNINGFAYSCKKISHKTNISRQTISSVLKTLQEMGIIEITGNFCTINIRYYLNIISLYNGSSNEERPQISTLFQKHDIETLQALFIEKNIDNDITVADMTSGGIETMFDVKNLTQNVKNLTQDVKNLTHPSENESNTWDNIIDILKDIWQKYPEDVKNLTQNVKNLTSQASDVKNLTQNVKNLTFNIEDMYQKSIGFIDKNFTNTDFLGSEGFCRAILTIGIDSLAQYMLRTYHGGVKNLTLGCKELNTSKINNIYNINKLSECNEDSIKRGENKNLNFEKGIERAQEGLDEKDDVINLQDRSKENYRNPYRNKPYYSQLEFKTITTPFNNGSTVKHPEELFIYMFWWSVYEELFLNIYYPGSTDENNSEEGYRNYDNVTDLQMEGVLLPANEILKIVGSCYEDLEAAVEKGYYEETDELGNEIKIKLTVDDFQDFNPFYIFDWEPCELEGEKMMRVSTERVRNIILPDIDRLRMPLTKDEIRLENRKSQEMIDMIRKSDAKELTPVEAAIKSFLDEFAVFEDTGRIETFRVSYSMKIPGDGHKNGENIVGTADTRELGRQSYIRTLLGITEKFGISISDFLSVRLKTDGGETILCRGAVFSYTKVANLNSQKRWNSKITCTQPSETVK